MFKQVFLVTFLLLSSMSARANEPSACIARYVPDAREIGKGSYYFLMKNVYDVALYGTQGHYAPDKSFALSLTYHMDLKGRKIAQKSIDEMKQLGEDDADSLADWQAQLNAIFSDVTDGMTLTGVRMTDGKTVFCKDNKKIGVITDPDFGRYFFGIWLDKKTEDPTLRAQLLNPVSPKE